MIEIKEKCKDGYAPLKINPSYMINTEKGRIINKKNKIIGYIPPFGSNVIVYIKADKHKPTFLNELVYNQENTIPLNRKTHYIKHKDKNHENCSYDNLKLVKKGKDRKKPLINIDIEQLTGDDKGNIEHYSTYKQCESETGITKYYLKKAIDEPMIIKDKNKNTFKITVSITNTNQEPS